jgi:hypothetical protein
VIRAELEARIWAITGRELTGSAIDAILDVAEEYTAERQEHHRRGVLHHASGSDLHPVIGVLADALLAEAAEHDELAARRRAASAA